MKFILVADQDKPNRILVSRVFQSLGFQVYEAASCADAKKIIAERPIDLVIGSERLPDGNLTELIRVSHSPNVAFVPFALPANSNSITNRHDLTHGYLLKPVTTGRAFDKAREVFPSTVLPLPAARVG